MRWVSLCILAAACAATRPAPMPLAEIFEQPEGVRPRRLAFSPDGKTLTYLLEREPGGLSDLWARDVATSEDRILLAAEGRQQFSDEERAARERRREHAIGISEYAWNPKDGTILVPVSGDLFRLRDGRLERLTETPGHELYARWSPDGKSIAFVRDQNLHVLRDGKETQLTFRGVGKTRCGLPEFIAMEELGRHEAFWWSPDSRRIAYVRTEAQQVPTFRMLDHLAPYGRLIEQEYPRAGDPNVLWWLCVVPAEGGEPVVMKLDGEYLVRVDWTPDGALAVQVSDRAQRKLTLHRCDPDTGASTVLLEETDGAWVAFHHDLRFLPDGRFVWTSERSGWKHLYLWEEGRLRPLTSGDWDVAAVVHANEERVLFMGSRETPLERHLYRVRLDGTGLERLTEPGSTHDVLASDDGARVADTFSAGDRTPVILVDRSRLNEAAAVPGPHPEYLTVPAADGAPLHAMLYRSPLPGRRPVIVHTYGGPGSQLVANRWGGSTGLWHRRMANLGYHVFTIDNRGCRGHGRDVVRAVSGRLCHLEVQDQIAGARWLMAQPWVDPDRIGIWGWSYGGTMALMCVLEAPDVFRAAVSVAPVTDWRDYDTAYTERYLGLPEENPEGYDLSSPITKAHTLSRPVLLVHGFLDDNVHFRGAVAFLDRVQRAGGPLEIDFYPRGAHGIGDKNIRKRLFANMEDFWRRRLGE